MKSLLKGVAGALLVAGLAPVSANEGTEPSSLQAVRLTSGRAVRLLKPGAAGRTLWALPFELTNQTGGDRDLLLTFILTTDVPRIETVPSPSASENTPGALRTVQREVYDRIYGGDDEWARLKLQEFGNEELLTFSGMNGLLRDGETKRGAVFFTDVPEEAKQFAVHAVGLTRTERAVRAGREYHAKLVNGTWISRVERDPRGGPPEWIPLHLRDPIAKDKYERALQVNVPVSVEDQVGPNDVFESLRFHKGRWQTVYYQVNKKDPIFREPAGTVFHERWALELTFRRPPAALPIAFSKIEFLDRRWILLVEPTL